MSHRVAFFLFVVLDILSLAALFWVISFHLELLNSISLMVREIEFDSGANYLFGLLILPVIHATQLLSRYREKSVIAKSSGVIVISFFIFLLALINVLNFYTKRQLDAEGYVACSKISQSSVGRRGEEWLYRLGDCNN